MSYLKTNYSLFNLGKLISELDIPPPASFPRMVLQDGPLPGRGVDVGVYFRGEDALVSEHLLDDTQVGPVFYKMCRETVTESVRGYFLVDSGKHRLLFHHREKSHPAEFLPETVQEQDVVELRRCTLRPDTEIFGNRPGRHLPKGYDPLLVALPYHAHEPLFKEYPEYPEVGGLGHTKAALGRP